MATAATTVSIYCVHNIVNGKNYVGKTIKAIDQRWKQHVRASKTLSAAAYGTYLSRAIRKYGESSFVAYPLAWAPQHKSSIYERLWIVWFESHKAEHGYNLTMGGEGVIGNDAVRKKASLRLKGTPPSPATILGAKKWHEEHPNFSPMKGRKHTAEAKARNRESHTRKDIRNDEIASLYEQGLSLNEIAERQKADPGTIRLRLKNVGVKLRPRGGGSHKKNQQNQGEIV